MLNKSLTLNYIKQNLSYPFQVLEMTDEEIFEYLKQYVIVKFSKYLPDVVRLGVNLKEDRHKTNISNEFRIFDPENCSIIGIVEFIPILGGFAFLGHPIMGVLNFEQVEKFVYDIERSRNAFRYSQFDYTIEFLPPNTIRIEPEYKDYCVLIYERVHPEDLSTIPVWAEDLFLDYCLGHIQILLGNRRKKFSTIQTPYGEVPLNADELKSDGKELIQQVEENLKLHNPSIIFDVG